LIFSFREAAKRPKQTPTPIKQNDKGIALTPQEHTKTKRAILGNFGAAYTFNIIVVIY